MSVNSHPPIDKRVDLGLIKLKKDIPVAMVTNNDTIFKLDNFETGFFKLKYNYTEIRVAIDCGTNANNHGTIGTRDNVAESNKEQKKLGDVWLLVVCIDPTTGLKSVIREKVN